MKHLQSLLLGFCLATTGCGGGGGGTSGGGTIMVPPAAPTPTPSRPATPVIDFTQDLMLSSRFGFALTTTVWTDRFGFTNTVTAVEDDWLPDGPAMLFAYKSATDSVQFIYGDRETNYSAADRTDQATGKTYSRDGNTLQIFRPDPTYKYVFAAYQGLARSPYMVDGSAGTRSTYHVGIFGYGSTATSRMDGALNRYPGKSFVRGGRSIAATFFARDVELSVNSGQGRVTGSMYLDRSGEQRSTHLIFTGTLNDASNTFSGTLSDFDNPDTGYRGSFRGALYGPSRDELAVVFSFTSPGDAVETYVGEMLSKRMYPCGAACSTGGTP